jgi:hypothetical protein
MVSAVVPLEQATTSAAPSCSANSLSSSAVCPPRMKKSGGGNGIPVDWAVFTRPPGGRCSWELQLGVERHCQSAGAGGLGSENSAAR